ncbi:nucleotidyl transferase AbiEii/AbiGii toxin family protein [Aegicerativicinus sediminis]|uniref:nucleotidyl transferase AbiEii/AbiGii toxin family protein n=1 Tax=Aegicerativicinus sediminis TaxID=2893202 RepID=UPI001E63588B|nr:nucleotidyl transferase AbiEii/AbiGii toxin family protein [Aegicerativicinus sediminis]
MLKNTLINIKATKKVAAALGDLNDEVVYVGGAMVSLYIDDPAAEDIRPTKDIDLTFQLASFAKLEELREALVARGFTQNADDPVNCRFRYEDLFVDVMSTEGVGWAPSNPWFKMGFEKAITKKLDEVTIKILPLSYFLATKMVAFYDRGIKDIYASHDLEDITYLLNYTSDIDTQIMQTDVEVKDYLIEKLTEFLNNKSISAAMQGCLHYSEVEERMEIIQQRIKNVIGS